MNRKQKADEIRLLASIEHWEQMRDADIKTTRIFPGPSTCALCEAHLRRTGLCGSCPVRRYTGIDGCGDTPYEQAAWAFWAFKRKPLARLKSKWRQAAEIEIHFLQRVLAAVRLGEL